MDMRWKRRVVAALAASIAMTAFAEDGITEDSILIGQTVGLTGTVAGAVKEMNEGAHAYIAGVNRQGGVNGRKIILRIVDDKFMPALAAANAEKLITQDHVFALFQSRGTPQTEAILPLLETHQVPLVAPSTGAEIFHTPVNRWLFNVRAKYQDEVIKAIEHFTTVGINKIGLLTYEKEDPLGMEGLAGFNKGMTARQLSPAIIAIFPRLKPDIKATAAKLIAAKPAALIIVSSGENTIDIIKELRAQGGSMQIMTMSNNSSQEFARDLGPAANGILVTQVTPAPHLVSSVLGQEFKVAAKGTGTTVSYAAMEGFVSAKVLVEGLRRAGRNLTRENFVHALESMKHADLGGLMVNYGPRNHTGSQFVEITMLGKDGRFVR
jgi:ABC-type branched-subunit amino acid transport system substrate-binding protein